jgi:hypothetical protein
MPIGPIPAGIYRCIGESDGEVHFTVGKKGEAIFSLENIDSTVAVPVSFASGRKFSVRPKEFMTSYHRSEESEVAAPPSAPGAPALTCCMMSVLIDSKTEFLQSFLPGPRSFDA